MPEELPEPNGSDDLNQPPPFFPQNFVDEDGAGIVRLVEVKVEAVYAREDGATREHFVVVRDGYRRLPIAIDPCNALSINMPLDNARPDRPMTHDLLSTIVEKMGGQVDRVVIDDLWSSTYYAKLVLVHNGEEMEIDSRPSDAIAVAVRCQTPIFVSETIMESASD